MKRKLFEHREHLVRATVLFVGAFFLLAMVGGLVVPKDFGLYGHYRAGALDDSRKAPLVYAGRGACAQCHEKVVDEKGKGKHANVGCESCHGPLAAHAADSKAAKPKRPEAPGVCLVCHQVSVARPDWFPQIDPRSHGDGASCDGCHLSHDPKPPEE